MSIQRLTEEEIARALKAHPQWERKGDAIERVLVFDGFREAIDFVMQIAPHADAADHHPEIFNVYNRVELRLTTHDADGLTQKDFDLAAKIDEEV